MGNFGFDLCTFPIWERAEYVLFGGLLQLRNTRHKESLLSLLSALCLVVAVLLKKFPGKDSIKDP